MIGRNRAILTALAVVVTVLGVPVAHAARPQTAAGAPVVQTMIVGQTSVLRAARGLRAAATSVRASGRRCAVAAGTPLAALAADRRAGGPGLRIRDYGRCSRTQAAGSGALFVYEVGSERNRGADGWAYKVNGRIGTTGAADPSGPFGTGRRLRAGDQLLWFWCQAGSRGCQRSLVVRARHVVRVGSSLQVSVLGMDDQARSVPVRGAMVTLGSATAITSSTGSATLSVPVSPGTYELTASRPALVPAFPERITVQ